MSVWKGWTMNNKPMIDQTHKIVCDVCDGTGRLTLYNAVYPEEAPIKCNCTVCMGSGYLAGDCKTRTLQRSRQGSGMTRDDASQVILAALLEAGHATRTQIDADRIAIALDAVGLLSYSDKEPDRPRISNAPRCHPNAFWVSGSITGQPVTSASYSVAVCSVCGLPAQA